MNEFQRGFALYKIRYLESIDNIASTIKSRHSRDISPSAANDISACLQQGRMFFESARKSSVVIKPIEIYYGAMAFSAALYLAMSSAEFCDIPKTHGLKPKINDKFDLISVKCEKRSLFNLINDIFSEWEGVTYFVDTSKRFVRTPFTMSNELSGAEISIKDIFSRLPCLEEIYRLTFGEETKFTAAYLHSQEEPAETTLDISIDEVEANLDSYFAATSLLRQRHPILNQWILWSAQNVWDKTRLVFANRQNKNENQLLKENYILNAGTQFHLQSKSELKRVDFKEILPPMFGGFSDAAGNQIVEPIEGKYLSEYSLFFLGSFLLCSLARYHPTQWMEMVSLKADKYTAIVECFMDECLDYFPRMVTMLIRGDDYRKEDEKHIII